MFDLRAGANLTLKFGPHQSRDSDCLRLKDGAKSLHGLALFTNRRGETTYPCSLQGGLLFQLAPIVGVSKSRYFSVGPGDSYVKAPVASRLLLGQMSDRDSRTSTAPCLHASAQLAHHCRFKYPYFAHKTGIDAQLGRTYPHSSTGQHPPLNFHRT